MFTAVFLFVCVCTLNTYILGLVAKSFVLRDATPRVLTSVLGQISEWKIVCWATFRYGFWCKSACVTYGFCCRFFPMHGKGGHFLWKSEALPQKNEHSADWKIALISVKVFFHWLLILAFVFGCDILPVIFQFWPRLCSVTHASPVSDYSAEAT